MKPTPEERYYLPAEWAPHAATWIAWPHERRDWPGKMGAVRWAFAEIARRVTEGERLRIIVRDATHEVAARSILQRAHVSLAAVDFFRIPTNRGWTRDMGPIFLRQGDAAGPLVVGDFKFTGWAKYSNYDLDDRVAAAVARRLRLPLVPPMFKGRRLELEGGAIDVNGHGTLLTTEQCLLDHSQQPRNAHLSQEELEAAMRQMLGVSHIFYLREGIVGDDTGGHIDDLARFVNPSTVVMVRCDDPQDANYRPLADAWERIADLRLENGKRPEVVALPSPRPLYFAGTRLPASYANFYIANAAVLVPTFNDPADRVALGMLAELIPDRFVVGIHAVDLVWGFGTIHCLTQQEPQPSPRRSQ